MFEAIDEHGNRINSQLETAHSLAQKILYCPYCRTRLRVRQGKRRLHFVHLTSCTGESTDHVFWKTYLAAYFRKLHFEVELEAVRGKRRFDLLLQPGAIGIEIQRSKMSADEWKRRALLDQQSGYEVRWIGFRDTEGPIFQMDAWMKQAFSEDGYVDVVEKGRIVRYTYPLPFARRVAFCQRVPLTVDDFLSPCPIPRKFPERQWATLVKNYRLRPFFSSLPSHYLRHPLYQSRLHVSTVPSWCYLPLSSLISIPIHPFELQLAAFLRLKDDYSEQRLTTFLTSCLTECHIAYEWSCLHELIREWQVMIDFIKRTLPELFKQDSLDLAGRLQEDQKLAGALRLFVERETGINEVKE
ncbi:competence protein CoiA family protein [Exiguobacterium undae]|uniref:competence protein CoiA family protein n=1 Tax=Exiguobacterium undae TaxID=169177 RepID=UPI00047D1BE8|nr:competence protein CoiA family protein [Exiguobacterium undae]